MSAPTVTTLSLGETLKLAAVGGRSDRLRIVLTATGSALAAITLLAALAVVFIGPTNGPYHLDVLEQDGLHVGVVIALGLLSIPVFLFVGLCSRLGAPARDRRLAAIRMAGATPKEVVRVVIAETGLAATIGAIGGTITFLIAKSLLNTPKVGTYITDSITTYDRGVPTVTNTTVTEARYLFPTDVSLPLWAIAIVPFLLIAGTCFASLLTMRKVAVSPFGVTRLMPTRPPRALPGMLFAGGALGLVTFGASVRGGGQTNTSASLVIVLTLFVIMMTGLITGSASIAAGTGRFLVNRVRSPALLIAGRRMIAAPYTANRATTAVLLAAIIGGATQIMRSATLSQTAGENDAFYASTFQLIEGVLGIAVIIAAASLLVTTAEAVVSRRRTLASLVAGGVPKSVLQKAALAETLIPLVPTTALAVIAGAVSARGFTGSTVEVFNVDTGRIEDIAIPVPWERLATLGTSMIVACVALTALSLIFMRSATNLEEMRTAA